MTTTGFSQSTSASAGDRLLAFAGSAFNRAVAAWRRIRNRRSVAKLLEWDAYMLRDIGITPGDVRSALAAPVTDDPSYRLGVMSVERRAAFRAHAQEQAARRTQRNPVRSKNEALAGAHRPERRVPPHRILEL